MPSAHVHALKDGFVAHRYEHDHISTCFFVEARSKPTRATYHTSTHLGGATSPGAMQRSSSACAKRTCQFQMMRRAQAILGLIREL